MAIGAAASYVVPAVASYLASSNTNKANSDNTASANATSIELANTSYQRRVADLNAAGLNPMLAYTQGGAATPPIATPTVENAGQHAINSGQAGYQLGKASDLITSQVKTQDTQQAVNNAIISKTNAEADLATASAAEVRARTPTYGPQIDKVMAEIDKIAQDTKLSFQETARAKQEVTNAMLHGDQIQAVTGNTIADTRLKMLNTEIGRQDLRSGTVSANAAESPLGRYVMPFMPFVNSAGKFSGGK
nr:MAG: DNA pilot protein [Microviridae sp.]